ncbi:MAG: 5'-methylthioadenosine/S-adenosylhomocysteine nucleosidase [Acholeplasmataceae bacterium]|jgi:adenosylhomocysteine nucleosidase|nr:5'-methylthioadenosine/S-adenosylhomocysteine nucleosidase [Acholeplasmataceae bacterium]
MILIVCAMDSEASEIKKEIKELEVHKLTPNKLYYEGKIKEKKVVLVVTGVGKVNAASAVSVLLSKYDFSQIINIGIAGATKPYSVGDKVVIRDASYADFDVTAGNFGYEFGQVPNMPNPFLSDYDLIKKCTFALGAYEDSLYTQDKFVTKKDIKNPGVYDMEGAAIYQVAHMYQVKVISIKLISDIINSPTQLDGYEVFEFSSSIILKEMLLSVI